MKNQKRILWHPVLTFTDRKEYRRFKAWDIMTDEPNELRKKQGKEYRNYAAALPKNYALPPNDKVQERMWSRLVKKHRAEFMAAFAVWKRKATA